MNVCTEGNDRRPRLKLTKYTKNKKGGGMEKMNTNIMGKEGYYAATVAALDGTRWGFAVNERYGNVFTVQLAEELLSWANSEYKKGCPKGYYEKAYSPDAVFTKIRYDMTDYTASISFEGDDIMVPNGKKKIGTYDAEKKLLRIWEDGLPIYENNDGAICKDSGALADCLM